MAHTDTNPEVGSNTLPETLAPDFFAAYLRYRAGLRQNPLDWSSDFYEYGWLPDASWGCVRPLSRELAQRTAARADMILGAIRTQGELRRFGSVL